MRFADLRNEFRALDNCPDSNSIEALSAAITVSTPTSCANSCCHRRRASVTHVRACFSFPCARLIDASCICRNRSEEHTSELQSLMRISYAVFCLKKTHTSTYMLLLIYLLL